MVAWWWIVVAVVWTEAITFLLVAALAGASDSDAWADGYQAGRRDGRSEVGDR